MQYSDMFKIGSEFCEIEYTIAGIKYTKIQLNKSRGFTIIIGNAKILINGCIWWLKAMKCFSIQICYFAYPILPAYQMYLDKCRNEEGVKMSFSIWLPLSDMCRHIDVHMSHRGHESGTHHTLVSTLLLSLRYATMQAKTTMCYCSCSCILVSTTCMTLQK